MAGKKTVGIIYTEAVSFLKSHYKPLLIISGLYLALSVILSAIVAFVQMLTQVVTMSFSFLAFLPAMLASELDKGFSGDPESVFFVVSAVLGLLIVIVLLFLALFVVMLVSMIFAYACQIILNTFTVSLQESILDLSYGRVPAFSAKWQSFSRNWKRYLAVSAWSMLWTFLWSLLFVVPGIIKAFSYAFAPYLIIEYPDMTYRQALVKSIEITRGFKGRLFGFSLISLGFGVLGLLTFCTVLGPLAACLFWVLPLTFVLFNIAYLDIKAAAMENGLLPQAGTVEACIQEEPVPPVCEDTVSVSADDDVPVTSDKGIEPDNAFEDMEEESPEL